MCVSTSPVVAQTGQGFPARSSASTSPESTSLLRVRLDRLDVLVDAQRTQDTGAAAPGHDAGDRVEIVLTPSKVFVVD